MINWTSFGQRFRRGLKGAALGALLGPIVLLLGMGLYKSDFGLDNIRPAILIGAVFGFGVGVISRERSSTTRSYGSILKPITRFGAGVFSLALAALGLLTGQIYDLPSQGQVEAISWSHQPGLFLFFLSIWISLGAVFVGLSIFDLLEAGGHPPKSVPGLRMLFHARNRWETLSVPIQILIVVGLIFSPVLYFAARGLFG
jgi:hypothetical protein